MNAEVWVDTSILINVPWEIINLSIYFTNNCRQINVFSVYWIVYLLKRIKGVCNCEIWQPWYWAWLNFTHVVEGWCRPIVMLPNSASCLSIFPTVGPFLTDLIKSRVFGVGNHMNLFDWKIIVGCFSYILF